jgi:glycerol-1-phosphate dehydrogenase [NAD(P)+]
MFKNTVKESEMVFPREVLIGSGYINRTTELCRKLKVGKRILIVTGKTTKSLVAERVFDDLNDREFDCDIVVEERATEDSVNRVKEVGKNRDLLMGIGGGSKIDIAKLASFSLNVPFISVPTAASHDGIASPRASIKRNGTSISVEASAPMAIVADTSIIAKAPYRLTASGCADLIAKKSALKDWELAHRLKGEPFSSFASALAMLACDTIIENGDNIKEGLEESAWIVVKSLVLSGVSMSIAGSSRPASGSEHLFAHALDSVAPGKALHGEECGVGTIMMLYLHGEDWTEAKEVLKKIKAPTNAKELGVSDEAILEALTTAHKIRKDRYTILGDNGITPRAAENVARITGVIQ